uniref:Uncharacterized protein n=1 Tax=Panagrolaimus sp. JU765 TaxID=591449 RepID=A0AC34QUX2_9BILA
MSNDFVMEYLVDQAKTAGLSTDSETLTSRKLAEILNENDELKNLRNEFFIPKKGTLPEADPSLIDPEEDSIYLCGNSLGLMPKITKTITDEQFDKWSKM